MVLMAMPVCGDACATMSPSRVIERLVDVVLGGATPPSGGLVCLLGQAGSGKSTLMAALCRNGSARRPDADAHGWRYLGVLGCHFCSASMPQTLACRAFVDGFAASLTASPHTKAFKTRAIERPIELLRVYEATEPLVAFRGLLRLCAKLPNTRQRRIVYVVDGLDESLLAQDDDDATAGKAHASVRARPPTIADLIFRCAKEAPPWLTFLVTCKSEGHDLGRPVDSGGADAHASSFLCLTFPSLTALVPVSAAGRLGA